jgi:sec-independent protein translocase protein TatC
MTDRPAGALTANHAIRRDTAMPFSSHLAELRKSLIVSAVAVIVSSFAAYYVVDPVMRIIALPVGRLYFLSPAEAFMTKLKVAVFAGGILSTPVIFFEAWSFIRRGLFPCEQRTAVLLSAVSLLLFMSGGTFCYMLVLPASITFLMGYGSDVLVPFLSVTNYLSFVCRMVLSFGVVFELPLVMWFLARTGLVRSPALRRNRRLAVVLVFLAAAVLTPTGDVFNQALMAGPLLLLYEAGIIAARMSEKKQGGVHGENRIT